MWWVAFSDAILNLQGGQGETEREVLDGVKADIMYTYIGPKYQITLKYLQQFDERKASRCELLKAIPTMMNALR